MKRLEAVYKAKKEGLVGGRGITAPSCLHVCPICSAAQSNLRSLIE